MSTSSASAAAHDYHHGDLPNTLLRAVEEIIVESGLRGVSLREAARRAGVSHSAPAHHFGDKDGLLAAFAQEGFRTLEQALRGAAVSTMDEPPMDQMAALGLSYVRFAAEHPAHFDVMFRSGLDKTGHDELHDQADATFTALEERVVALQEAGFYSDESTEAVSLYFWSLAHGAASLWVDGQISAVLGDADLEVLATEAIRLAAVRPAAG